METISNMATQAAKAVWGDSAEHKEPLSGAQGDVSHGEPYDAGNLGNSEQQKLERKLSGEDESAPSKLTDDTNKGTTTDTAAGGTTITSSSSSSDPISSSTDSKATDSNKASGSSSKPTDIEASTGKPSEVGSSAAEEGDPNTHVMGDGPKPLETVAREHGGDAGNIGTTADSSSSSNKKPGEEGGEGDKHDGGESKGTGEEYVKTTGFAADGGDFDATKPGAGREADRLLEEKGVHHDTPGKKDSSPSSGGNKDDHHHHSKDKPSLGERIKNKLHRHKE
ncbi:hypothetical protein VFPFJ_06602 [Purpureocillium lilacinum]|nr:hypothetical protein VFPFJ_06602 [Purpureocillium lilacinum]OAQ80455.1 hypothetical protein VFPBJ_06040 [Purpureocillium lilacinum]OAQ88137.1 hypothetical protein VFPFJ_06602 [Purpureocillium lilacinum]PWI69945.1 hypothetical protein PCL_00089 [Purpureocillium lilacinum]GJN75062.1 hypothetical protein PLICBS_009158 [Purpureocillium lilacinum]GJN85204.1 hypothetical protein PLIIFM63780_008768 [Purpureocillium lilacinum]